MLRNRLYYTIKPFVPWSARMSVRRWFARRKREQVQSVWPIQPGSEKTPAGWPGWPEGKQFAFVLTHDVEGSDGLARCRQLAELEMSLGFRSCFNFIPEGDYRVPPDLLTWLAENGFEVGVHDLYHAGTLHRSHRDFLMQSERINLHLKNWNAVGFRAGFMRHNLDWQHALDVQYDCSTFDTDPFEPQSDGVGTIFPFWVPNPDFNLNLNPHPTRADQKSEIRNQKSDPTSEFQLSALNSQLLERSQPSTLNPQPSDSHASRLPHHVSTPSSILQPPASGVRGPLSALPSRNTQHASRSGYVELPYTLPQDSTLFLLFRERSPEIWLRKLDWVAQHGGMALVNVHPDYLRFPGQPAAARTFPVEFYAQLLEYVRDRYAARHWHALPRELSNWYKSIELPIKAPRTLAGRRAAVLVYSDFLGDPRPRRAAETLVDEGSEVDVICLGTEDNEPLQERCGSMNIRRIPLLHQRSGKLRYLWQYSLFFLHSFRLLTGWSLRRHYDLVHVHNMPDALVFAAIVPKLLGARVILDLHDPMPEVYETMYGLSQKSAMIKWLMRFERWSIRFANLVFTPNKAFVDCFCSRGCPPEKIHTVMNTPDERLFNPMLATPTPPEYRVAPGEFRIMFHGTIVARHGLDTAVEAMRLNRADLPTGRLSIYGRRTVHLGEIEAMVQRQALEPCVQYCGQRIVDQIPQEILRCDVGLIPNHRSCFTEINLPTRIFEYLALRKPVIAPRTRGILDYFGPQDLIYFEAGDAADLARVLRWVRDHPLEVREIRNRGIAVYEQHRWHLERAGLLKCVRALLT